MSRFNSEAYDKLFPRETPKEEIETVVETFTPTKDKLENKEVDDVNVEHVEDDDGEDSDGN